MVIPTQHKCVQIAESRDDNELYCSKCIMSQVDYIISDGVCCKKGNIFVKGHLLQKCAPKEYLIDNCSEFNDESKILCTKCKDGFNLSQGICCPENQYPFLNAFDEYSCTNNTI